MIFPVYRNDRAGSPPVFVKRCAAEPHCHSHTTEISPSDSMFFLARQILTGELICMDFCAILFTNQLENKTKQCSSPGVHRGAWCLPAVGSYSTLVMGPSARLTSLLARACLLGIPVRGALTSGSRQLVSKFKKTYSQNLGGGTAIYQL